ncbi:hypothetical protein LWI29_024071 [Acer saccharum]|uniref:DUF674 domain-containing protein n=1 Tax=Acer saccharum TaxID=4024 RepID=A0AA39SPZ1_ACESA|nr:hypothetical protein LWI29_024071 [Acer saccharum]
MATASKTSKVMLKLLIDTKGQRVLFAEAGKDFVDFLFYLLSLPEEGDVGCLTDLYQSLENLNETYMQPNQNKISMLNPKSSLNSNGLPLMLSDNHDQSTAGKFYLCGYYNHVSDVYNSICPCGSGYRMTKVLTFVNSSAAANSSTGTTAAVEGGFVKGVVTYMVMDNLEVKPMSTISSIALLNEFNVQNVRSLKEKIVVLGVDEGMKLLKASLECKTVLSSIFLGDTAA